MKRTILYAFAVLTYLTGSAQEKQPLLTVIPEPASVQYLDGQVLINTKMKYFADSDPASRIADMYVSFLEANYGIALEKGDMKNSTLIFSDDTMLPEEGYQLTVARNKIVVQGHGAGLFYGLQTLEQLTGKQTKTGLVIPGMTIKDQPRFAYRGQMLDAGRYFFPVSYVKQFIDVMAHYKFNRFHWHLTEDQGWRIEIKKYPKLQSIASQRKETSKGHYRDNKFDGKPHGGFYTQEEVKEVVQYAADRFITVVPEIEMPGHAQAALAAYPNLGCTGGPYEVSTKWGVHKEVFCAGNDEVFTFLEDVLTEVIPLFPGKYVHIGGDECPKDRWKACPKCQARIKALNLKDEHGLQSYFIQRMEKFLNSKGKKIIGWDEILEGGLAPDATVMSWRGETGGIAAAKQKHDVIMSPNTYLYLDYYQGNPATEPLAIGGFLPLSKVYSYEPYPKDLSAEEKKYIKGVQANLWTEYLPDAAAVDYSLYPRALAAAEIAWSPAEKKNYGRFTAKLPHLLDQLDKRGVKFRIPEAFGAENLVVSGPSVTVSLRSPINKGTIYYTLDGTTPTVSSLQFSKPVVISVAPNQTVTLKYIVVSASGRSSSVYSNYYSRKAYQNPVAVNPVNKGVTFQAFYKAFNKAAQIGSGKADTSGVLPDFSIRPFVGKVAFGVKYEGYVKIEETGLYEFKTNSDDGSVLTIGNEVIVNNDGEHGATEISGMVPLLKGFHRITVQYFDLGGDQQLQVSFGLKGKQNVNLRNALFH